MTNAQPTDTQTTEELIQLALTATDEDTRWDLVSLLRKRGGQTEFDAAMQLCQSDDPRRRELGADILSQLKSDQNDFHTESVQLLLTLLNDTSEDVLYAAIMGLGHRGDDTTVPALCAFADHPCPDIRFAVAFALGGFENELAVNALICLTSDVDRDTRDWATFGLGSQIANDTPELRAALLLRTDDEDHEIRGEALVGLAIRRDERALALVQRELDQEYIGVLALEACEHLGDPVLLPRLRELEADWAEDWKESPDLFFQGRLQDAITACEANETNHSGT